MISTDTNSKYLPCLDSLEELPTLVNSSPATDSATGGHHGHNFDYSDAVAIYKEEKADQSVYPTDKGKSRQHEKHYHCSNKCEHPEPGLYGLLVLVMVTVLL